MSKRVFFSFHYDDVKTFRANVVRNHDLTKQTGSAGFFDASIWEDAELHGDESVKRLINSNLENTSVTCVLIGSNTWSRRWVRYEIMKSYDRGNTILGVHINSIPDKFKNTYTQGVNPFSYLGFFIGSSGELGSYQELVNGQWCNYNDLKPTSKSFDRKFWNNGYNLSSWIPCYDWVLDDGYKNFASWIESAK